MEEALELRDLLEVVLGVGAVCDEQDPLLAEALQGEVVVGGLAGVDDVEPGLVVRRHQVVQVDVSLHHHLGHVVQLH